MKASNIKINHVFVLVGGMNQRVSIFFSSEKYLVNLYSVMGACILFSLKEYYGN